MCVCRGFTTSVSRSGKDSWFKSLFVRKVDPRKDAHATLLTKNEESNLYKIQCEFSLRFFYFNRNIYQYFKNIYPGMMRLCLSVTFSFSP